MLLISSNKWMFSALTHPTLLEIKLMLKPILKHAVLMHYNQFKIM